MIKHRCNKCKNFLGLSEDSCQCGWHTSGRKDLWFIKTVEGKRYTKRAGFITRIEAELLHGQWVDELFEPTPESKDLMSVGEAVSVYLEYLQGKGSRYCKDTERMLNRLSKVVGHNTPLNKIDVASAREYQRRIVNAGANLSTADRHVAMAKAMFNYVAPDTPNPFRRVNMFNPDNIVIRMLEPEQERKLLDVAERVSLMGLPWIYHYILIAMRTGLRKQNILKLRWVEIDFKTKFIIIRQKGDRRHSVPMSSDVAALMANTPRESKWCFPNKNTGLPYTDFQKTWRTCKALAKVEMDFRFHDLRHHVASKLMSNTRNPIIVQSILGHSDIRITQRYMHTWSVEMAEAVESLVIHR